MVIGRVNGVLNDTVLLKLVVYFLGFALFIDDFFFFFNTLCKRKARYRRKLKSKCI